ncbi:hypothetical protein QIA00_04905 (plasmid) [Borreliella americana]|uniref:Uncharacterized protein n=1 Tax=Borreliella americana TaxID=478807 RepID=A0ACD5G807_9SPIR
MCKNMIISYILFILATIRFKSKNTDNSYSTTEKNLKGLTDLNEIIDNR